MNEELIEVIKTVENGEEHYHLRPASEKYQFYKSAKVPKTLFEEYLHHRGLMLDFRKQLRFYFKPLKEKPMRIEKNHVNEGEVHKFNEDGSVTVIDSKEKAVDESLESQKSP